LILLYGIRERYRTDKGLIRGNREVGGDGVKGMLKGC
jgi:hypothetical protein